MVRVIRQGAGPTILILHAAGTTPEGLSSQIKDLSQDYTVVVPDLFDLIHGLQNPTFKDLAKALNDLFPDIKSFELVVGCSVGGAIALSYAANFSHKTKQLIICDCIGWPIKRSLFQWLKAWIKMSRQGHGYKKNQNLETAGWGFIIARMFKDPMDVFKLFKLGINGDIRDELLQVKAPVRICWGSDDQFVPIEYGKLIASQLEHANFEVVDSPIHYWYDLIPSMLIEKIRAVMGKS